MKPLKPLTIDLITNKNCNMNCTYCFEQGKFKNQDMTPEFVNLLINFLKEKRDEYKYSFIIIGGEPSLSKTLKYFASELQKEIKKNKIKVSKITYITNGLNLNIFNQFDIDFWKDILEVQISYDGKILQDQRRIIKKNDKIITTSDIVLKNIDEVYKTGVPLVIKSTITIFDFIHLKDIYDEFDELEKKYGVRYAVTEDKGSFFNLGDNYKEFIDNILKDNFSYIAKKEYQKYLTDKKFLTKWFYGIELRPSQAVCSAGSGLIGINTTGELMGCHIVDYYDNPEIDPNKILTRYGNIQDPKSFDRFLKRKEIINRAKIHPECEKCEAIYCTKCPMEKYGWNLNSKNPSYLLEHAYLPIDEKICYFYKTISKYVFKVYNKLNLL